MNRQISSKKCKHIIPINGKCIHIKTQIRYSKAVGCPYIFKTGIDCPGFTPKDNKDEKISYT